MVEKILNNTTPYGKIRASHEGSLHSSTLIDMKEVNLYQSVCFLRYSSNKFKVTSACALVYVYTFY